jgi:hypothetical protein
MKKRTTSIILLLMFCNTLALAQPFITKFDSNIFAQKNLQGYILRREGVKWNYGREYVFSNNEGQTVYLTVGIHSSKQKVHEVAIEYLSTMSIVMPEDTSNILNVGDRLWVWPGIDEEKITNVTFQRNNALVSLYAHHFNGSLISLAKSIDNAILKGDVFVEIGNKIHVPKINPSVIEGANKNEIVIELSKNSTIDTLDYDFKPGIGRINGQYMISNLEKYERIMDDRKTETIKVVGINQYNVVSEIAEFKLK